MIRRKEVSEGNLSLTLHSVPPDHLQLLLQRCLGFLLLLGPLCH